MAIIGGGFPTPKAVRHPARMALYREAFAASILLRTIACSNCCHGTKAVDQRLARADLARPSREKPARTDRVAPTTGRHQQLECSRRLGALARVPARKCPKELHFTARLQIGKFYFPGVHYLRAFRGAKLHEAYRAITKTPRLQAAELPEDLFKVGVNENRPPRPLTGRGFRLQEARYGRLFCPCRLRAIASCQFPLSSTRRAVSARQTYLACKRP